MCGLQNYLKKHIFVVFKEIIPITRVFMNLFWAFRPICWQPPFLLAHFGWQILISEAISAGQPKVAAKITNWLGTRSHCSHLSEALLDTLEVVDQYKKRSLDKTDHQNVGSDCCQSGYQKSETTFHLSVLSRFPFLFRS